MIFPRHRWLVGIAAGMTTAGAILTFLMINNVAGQLSQREWPIVDGEVISSKVAGQRAYHPRVIYQYNVDGIMYTDSSDLRAPGFGGKRKRLEVAERLVAQYRKGDMVEVHFNRKRPEDSYLGSSLRWGTFGRLGFGLTLYLAGFFIFLSLRRRTATKVTPPVSEVSG